MCCFFLQTSSFQKQQPETTLIITQIHILTFTVFIVHMHCCFRIQSPINWNPLYICPRFPFLCHKFLSQFFFVCLWCFIIHSLHHLDSIIKPWWVPQRVKKKTLANIVFNPLAASVRGEEKQAGAVHRSQLWMHEHFPNVNGGQGGCLDSEELLFVYQEGKCDRRCNTKGLRRVWATISP